MPLMDALSAEWFKPESVTIVDKDNLLQSWLSDEEIARLSGAPKESQVIISLVDGNVELRVKNRILSEDMVRLLVQNDDHSGYSCYIVNSVFVVDPYWQNKGIGARSVAIEILQAQRLKIVTKITTYAVGNYQAFLASNLPLRGYYVWAVMGFDGDLPPTTLDALPEKFKDCKKVLDLVTSPEGRDVWKQHGQSVTLSFDLADERCWNQLRAYMSNRQIEVEL